MSVIHENSSYRFDNVLRYNITFKYKQKLAFIEEGKKEMFYLTTHSTHYILQLYGVRHMVKDHSDRERGNLLLPHRLLFLINSNGSFICIIPQTG